MFRAVYSFNMFRIVYRYSSNVFNAVYIYSYNVFRTVYRDSYNMFRTSIGIVLTCLTPSIYIVITCLGPFGRIEQSHAVVFAWLMLLTNSTNDQLAWNHPNTYRGLDSFFSVRELCVLSSYHFFSGSSFAVFSSAGPT